MSESEECMYSHHHDQGHSISTSFSPSRTAQYSFYRYAWSAGNCFHFFPKFLFLKPIEKFLR